MSEGRIGIKGYTLSQFERFLDAADRRRARERADRLEETALAARSIFAKPDQVNNLLKGFRSNANKRPRKRRLKTDSNR